ncbi:hypothetical protein HDV57DRAFT_491592 [Trichoderma longibrachiatum]
MLSLAASRIPFLFFYLRPCSLALHPSMLNCFPRAYPLTIMVHQDSRLILAINRIATNGCTYQKTLPNSFCKVSI